MGCSLFGGFCIKTTPSPTSEASVYIIIKQGGLDVLEGSPSCLGPVEGLGVLPLSLEHVCKEPCPRREPGYKLSVVTG